MKTQMTQTERQQHTARRRTLRETAAAKVDALRDWHQARADKSKDAAKERAAALHNRPRGVDRVPTRLTGLAITAEPYEVSKRGTRLAQPADLHPSGNYESRRARGHRGHQRPTRRRDMPGAVERRLERNRRAAQDLWA